MEKITQYPVYSRPAKLHHELPLEKHPSAQHMEQEQWFWWRLKFQPIGYNFVTSNAMKKLRNIWMPQKNNGIKLTSGPQHINSGQPDDMICSQGQRKNSQNGSPSLQKARCNKKKRRRHEKAHSSMGMFFQDHPSHQTKCVRLRIFKWEERTICLECTTP